MNPRPDRFPLPGATVRFIPATLDDAEVPTTGTVLDVGSGAYTIRVLVDGAAMYFDPTELVEVCPTCRADHPATLTPCPCRQTQAGACG